MIGETNVATAVSATELARRRSRTKWTSLMVTNPKRGDLLDKINGPELPIFRLTQRVRRDPVAFDCSRLQPSSTSTELQRAQFLYEQEVDARQILSDMNPMADTPFPDVGLIRRYLASVKDMSQQMRLAGSPYTILGTFWMDQLTSWTMDFTKALQRVATAALPHKFIYVHSHTLWFPVENMYMVNGMRLPRYQDHGGTLDFANPVAPTVPVTFGDRAAPHSSDQPRKGYSWHFIEMGIRQDAAKRN
ncbi:hypothetical protein SARC_08496 [Sphaeroforma arctica JP610]|uniref:Uncharacterized protein n=1 Tax=Sphaeroforma arctica JP610 TaxID=667725 RepID=A0A0L0FQZ0_9EUKA|nr:hypothetical protein SARC_08496 [Sphaeroforma arctica JP610]KNC79099.1 hypothetical protein SARC_08496 [Sphaeroforma arctica JP610]|eukprot:XP_014153001.1 hypothetical protein SARC_08496 [Sphaeroforma arctica JP610]